MSDFRIGQTVETAAGQEATVRYVGPIHVADGSWLGLELSSQDGKNDGSMVDFEDDGYLGRMMYA